MYGVGDGRIWLDKMNCSGKELYIGECSHRGWGFHNCTHHQDVAVSCTNNTPVANVSDSTTVTRVRLVGNGNSTGRLEVRRDGVWGTVCSDFFTAVAVRVVCRMLGFRSGIKIDNRNYTTGHGPIWLDDVRCNGTETDIAECSHREWGVHNCQHREDVAVSCASTEFDMRLYAGRDPREGRPELFYSGTWTSISLCSDASARVVCKMLGFGHRGRVTNKYDGRGQNSLSYRHIDTFVRPSFWLKSFRCTGMERNIDECALVDWNVCWHSRTYEIVSCLADDSVVLVGGGSPREGRLELYHNGTWGTVCSNGFTEAAARVVCHSLGFGYVGKEMDVNNYGMGEGEIWLDDVHCDGTERQIGECSHRGWGIHNCRHHEDVAVSCSGDLHVPPSSTSSSTTSTGSAGNDDVPDTTQIVIAAIVVGGLTVTICVVVIAILVLRFRQNPPLECTEADVASSQGNDNNAAWDDSASSNFQ